MNTKKLDEFIDGLAECGIPGCDFAVTYKGQTVYRRMAGYADLERTRPVSEKDLYWVYSVSKVTACVAAMQLVERGIISLDDPVSKYIPEYASLRVKGADGAVRPAENVMTVLHAFTMTGGLDYDTHSPEIMAEIATGRATTVSTMAALAARPLCFEPGTKYRYSLCHDLLAAIVEVASGRKFCDYVKENITDPLGMTDTTYHPEPSVEDRICQMYCYDSRLMASKPVDWRENIKTYCLFPEYDSGGAGLCTTVNDQLRLATVLANGGVTEGGYRLLGEESIRMMGEGRLSDTAGPYFQTTRLYGYSWGLCGRAHVNKTHSAARSELGEFGWDGAAGAFILIDRKSEVAMYFGMEVHACAFSYHQVFPRLRDMAYELIGK